MFVFAAADPAKATSVPAVRPGQAAGRSHIGHLNFYKKDPAIWNIIKGGTRGKMKYNICGQEFDFVFNGYGLKPGGEYALVYYYDPWPGTGLLCLGSGTADEEGNIHLVGSMETDDLPVEHDASEGTKLRLVPSADVDAEGGRMSAWNPAEYLFEHDLIIFDDDGEAGPEKPGRADKADKG